MLRNNKLRTYLFFLFISIFIWLVSQLSNTYDYTFKLPVVYSDVQSANLIPKDTLYIQVKTTGFRIIANKYKDKALIVNLNKSNNWHPTRYFTQIRNLYGEDIQIVDIMPKSIEVK